MPDAAFRNASAKRDALAKEINSLQQRVHDRKAELTDVEAWLAAWHVYAGDQGDDSDEPEAEEHSENEDDGFNSVERSAERSRTTGNPKKEFVAANARRIVEEAGQPVSRADLFKELSARGIQIGGKDPEQVLSTMLWRTYRDGFPLIRLAAGGYWLADQPHKESGYDPVDGMTDEVARSRHAVLTGEIAEADQLYHSDDAPRISDAQYDAIRREIEKIEVRFPALATEADSVAQGQRHASSETRPAEEHDAQALRETADGDESQLRIAELRAAYPSLVERR